MRRNLTKILQFIAYCRSKLYCSLKGVDLGFMSVVELGAQVSCVGGGRIAIGRYCRIHCGAKLLSYGGEIRLGDECSVNPYSVLYGHGGLVVGRYVRIAAGCIVIPANHGIEMSRPIAHQPLSAKGIRIGNDVWLGAGVRVVDGVTIADGSVVGAGAIVVKATEPYSVNVGNPARKIRSRISGNTG